MGDYQNHVEVREQPEDWDLLAEIRSELKDPSILEDPTYPAPTLGSTTCPTEVETPPATLGEHKTTAMEDTWTRA